MTLSIPVSEHSTETVNQLSAFLTTPSEANFNPKNSVTNSDRWYRSPSENGSPDPSHLPAPLATSSASRLPSATFLPFHIKDPQVSPSLFLLRSEHYRHCRSSRRRRRRHPCLITFTLSFIIIFFYPSPITYFSFSHCPSLILHNVLPPAIFHSPNTLRYSSGGGEELLPGEGPGAAPRLMLELTAEAPLPPHGCCRW